MAICRKGITNGYIIIFLCLMLICCLSYQFLMYMECDITITIHKNVTSSTWSDLSHDWSLCIKILEVIPMYVAFCPACSRRGSPRAFHFVSHILSFLLNLVIDFHTIMSSPGPWVQKLVEPQNCLKPTECILEFDYDSKPKRDIEWMHSSFSPIFIYCLSF